MPIGSAVVSPPTFSSRLKILRFWANNDGARQVASQAGYDIELIMVARTHLRQN
jgi:hypothetical protein